MLFRSWLFSHVVGFLKRKQARKAQGLVAMDEDGLFELIRNSPEQRPSAAEIAKFNKQRKTEGAPAKPKALQTAAPLLPSPTPASAEEEQKKGPEVPLAFHPRHHVTLEFDRR